MDQRTSSAAPRHERRTAPYGSWTSPITARLLAESGVGLGLLRAAGDELFWLEVRPTDEGRTTLVRAAPGGHPHDVSPAGANVRTLVHEYGGGAYALHRSPDGGVTVFFSEFADQRLYRMELAPPEDGGEPVAGGGERPAGGNGQPAGAGPPGRSAGRPGGEAAAPVAGPAADGAAPVADARGPAAPVAVTPEPPRPRSLRYADACVTPDGEALYCVRERHEPDGVHNELVRVAAGDGEVDVVAAGHDFYAAPRLSPDGRTLAWLCWDQPQMPWDGTELWLADVTAAGGLAAERRVAGGPAESVLQPAWDAAGRLHFVSDRSGWWNLYRAEGLGTGAAVTALAPTAAEFAGPPWVFGLQNYRFLPDGRVVATCRRHGTDHLCVIEAGSPGMAGTVTTVPCALTSFAGLAVAGDRVAAVAGDPTRSPAVVLVDLPHGGVEQLRSSSTLRVDAGYLSAPEPIAFPTSYEPGSVRGPLADRQGEDLAAHALYYAPSNRDFAGPADEKPPLIVMSHGGPTSAAGTMLSPAIQFWTSRGFAVVDVDYGGSSGYGRAYRERLRCNWGVVDTVDCINAARHLVGRGDVDPARLAVTGGSAGGYTTLNALTRHDVFAAGASYFGVADLEAFAGGGTHKFEEHYLTGLVGPHPEHAGTYAQRSPINAVEQIACPVILFQGLEDPIVPPAQSEVIVAALERNGLPHAYLAFPGEQHGFRKAQSIARSIEAELYFYGKVFGFTPADDIEPVVIKNLE